jgi:hypothetical protein
MQPESATCALDSINPEKDVAAIRSGSADAYNWATIGPVDTGSAAAPRFAAALRHPFRDRGWQDGERGSRAACARAIPGSKPLDRRVHRIFATAAGAHKPARAYALPTSLLKQPSGPPAAHTRDLPLRAPPPQCRSSNHPRRAAARRPSASAPRSSRAPSVPRPARHHSDSNPRSHSAGPACPQPAASCGGAWTPCARPRS